MTKRLKPKLKPARAKRPAYKYVAPIVEPYAEPEVESKVPVMSPAWEEDAPPAKCKICGKAVDDVSECIRHQCPKGFVYVG